MGVENFRFREKGANSTVDHWGQHSNVDGSFTFQTEKVGLFIKDIDLNGEGKFCQLDVHDINLSMQKKKIDIKDIRTRFRGRFRRFYIPVLDLNIEDIPIHDFLALKTLSISMATLKLHQTSVLLPRHNGTTNCWQCNSHSPAQWGLSNPKIHGDLLCRLVTNVKKNGDWRRFIIGNIDSDWTWRKITSSFSPNSYAEGDVELSLQIYPKNNRFVANGMGTGIKFVEMARALSLSEAAWVDALLDIELDVGGRIKPFEFRGNVDVMAASMLVAGQSIETVEEPLMVIPNLALSGEMWLENQAFGLNAHKVSLPKTDGSIRTQFIPNGPYLDLDCRFSMISLTLHHWVGRS